MGLFCGTVYCNFLSISFQSGSLKKSAVSGGGAKASGEGKGAAEMMDKPPDKPETAIMVRRAALIIDKRTTPMVTDHLTTWSVVYRVTAEHKSGCVCTELSAKG